LVRFNVQLQLSNTKTILLPHVAAIRPFESYFVYDKEIQSKFHVMWLFESGRTALPEDERIVTGSVIQPEHSSTPVVFDGALIYPSRTGQKLRFLKGEEYRNDRTLNIIPERPQGWTNAGSSSPHREHLAHWFYKEMGVLSPRSEWFRVIHLPDPGPRFHSQQLVVQQVNEAFLEMNDRDPDADLYKRNVHNPVWEKHTNKEQGIQSITDLINRILTRDPEERRNALNSNLVIDEFMAYSVASVLMSNWDGFNNNHWMYLDPSAEKWEIVPWDLDKVWGFTDTNSMFVEMPVDFPLNGLAEHASREPGPVIGWLHEDEKFHQAYKNNLVYELNHALTQERMDRKIDEVQAILLEDLSLLESQTGTEREDLRKQILDSYQIIKDFVRLRREYLISEVRTPDTGLGDPSKFRNRANK
jgi:spore coat protein CotH